VKTCLEEIAEDEGANLHDTLLTLIWSYNPRDGQRVVSLEEENFPQPASP
jgi:hypothetical protein